MAETAYIGLGSNLGDRAATLRRALRDLSRREGIEVLAVSGLWETAPVGPVPQDDFLNAAAALHTDLAPRPLLAVLLAVEKAHGRVRETRWGPRTLDLDLLLWGSGCVDEPGLTVPHPHLEARRFVLAPLLEIAPDLRHPAHGGRLAAALAALPVEGDRVRRVADPPPQEPGQRTSDRVVRASRSAVRRRTR